MSKIGKSSFDVAYHQDGVAFTTGYMKPVSDEALEKVFMAGEDDEDGRSEWLWVRLPNGDLIMGVFPQGATYESVEGDAAW